jgi:hypothetical protein
MNRHTFGAVLPERVYAVGTHRSPEIDVPSGHTTFEIRIGVAEHLDPDTEIAVGLDISLDDGQTWQADGAAGRRGGVSPVDKTTGLSLTSMTMRGRLWGVRGRAARVRVSVRGHATTLGPVDLLVSDEAIGRRGPALA